MTFSNDPFNASQCMAVRHVDDRAWRATGMRHAHLEGMHDEGEPPVAEVNPGVETTEFTLPVAHRLASGADLEPFSNERAVPVPPINGEGGLNADVPFLQMLDPVVGRSDLARKRARKPRLDLVSALHNLQRMRLICGFKKSFIYEREDFPRPIRLGTSQRSAVRWIEHEVVEWVCGRAAARDLTLA
jgi:predicted DNA-binding transcriptional regulator AlpA